MNSITHGHSDDQIIEQALTIVRNRMYKGVVFDSPETVRNYLTLHFSQYHREVFTCLFLTTKHQLIAVETLFYGTIDAATVHSREVVKRALELNASALIVAHNHPSGVSEPSQSDRNLTDQLKKALSLVGISLIDHFVVGGDEITSLAELGIL